MSDNRNIESHRRYNEAVPPIAVRMSPDLIAAVEKLAKAEGVGRTTWIRDQIALAVASSTGTDADDWRSLAQK